MLCGQRFAVPEVVGRHPSSQTHRPVIQLQHPSQHTNSALLLRIPGQGRGMICGHFSFSCPALKEPSGSQMKQAVVTRWDSTFHMLDWLHGHRAAIQDFCVRRPVQVLSATSLHIAPANGHQHRSGVTSHNTLMRPQSLPAGMTLVGNMLSLVIAI